MNRVLTAVGAALLGFIAGFVGSSVMISFDYPAVSAVFGAAAALFFPKALTSFLGKKKKERELREFGDMLNSLCGSFSSGRNLSGALADSEADMRRLHGDACATVLELAAISDGLRNGAEISEMICAYAERSGLDDVQTFADTVCAAIGTGADLRAAVTGCRDLLCDKIRTEQQIASDMSGVRNELRIMCFLPFLVSLLTGSLWTGDSGFLRLAGGAAALAAVAIAAALGRRMARIRL
ncbi:MAG: hypothetical protein ILO42_07080 [Clostridia bacterium]|nr:hypothetical protein [Clostridia bacterium]